MKSIRLFSILALVALCASCNSGSTSVNGDNSNSTFWTIPNPGTSYDYRITAGSDTTLIVHYIITGTHLTKDIKQNVVALVGSFDDSSSAGNGYYAIESNGDISLGDSGANAFTWTTYPTGSRTTISAPKIDSTTPFGDRIVQTDDRTYVGTETVTTAAGTFSAIHVRDTQNSLDSSSSSVLNWKDITDLWWCPTIGMFVKQINAQTDGNSPSSSSEIDLIKYTPR